MPCKQKMIIIGYHIYNKHIVTSSLRLVYNEKRFNKNYQCQNELFFFNKLKPIFDTIER
jgi:hypothetical protein